MPEKMTDRKRKTKRSKFSSEESDSNSMSSSSSTSSSSEEETDAKDLKPIKEYLQNRKELASQLFKSVKPDKIRMMLPQTLKKVEFNDLEELCAAELIGMSKTRIMCIINGQEMLQSSDTNESDDSGPSLEIISDTEWLSEADTNIKVEDSKNNKDSKKTKKKSLIQKKLDPKSKLKPKAKGKLGKAGKPNLKVKLEKVKSEVKDKEKEKEGESLLDLLELEMRARAIRALIRKEEDSSNPSSNNASNNNTANAASSSNDNSAKSRQANLKEQLEKIDVLMKHGDDEDVFVVINPAPTIELLSSESENEEHSKRVHQKFVSERGADKNNDKSQEKQQSDNRKVNETANEKTINADKDLSNQKNTNKEKPVNKENNKGEKSTELNNVNKNELESATESNENNKQVKVKEPTKEEDLEDGEIIDEEDDNITEENKVTNKSPIKKIDKKTNSLHTMIDEDDNDMDNEHDIFEENETSNDSLATRTIKKVKKNPNIRVRDKFKESNSNSDEFSKPKSLEKGPIHSENKESSLKKDKIHMILDEPIEIEESPEREENKVEKILNTNDNELDSNSKIDLFDDKLLDIEEIINLDDYPDDIDDLERSEFSKPTAKHSKEKEKAATAPPSSETWATRYYQQDDVQNVIKESKIQSEIRKRLRERQRQRKLNNSPKLKEQEEVQPSPEPSTVINKPTGSVEEYLALKQLCKETTNNAPVQNVENIEQSVSSSISLDNVDTLLEKDDLSSTNVMPADMEDNNSGEKSIKTSTKKSKKLKKLQKKMLQKPVVIKKKPKLLENIAIVRKVDPGLNENIALELLNKVIRCDNSFLAKSEGSADQKNSVTMDEKSNVKDDSLLHAQTNLRDDLSQTEDKIVIKDNSSIGEEKTDTKAIKDSAEDILQNKISPPKDIDLHQSSESCEKTVEISKIGNVSSLPLKNEQNIIEKKEDNKAEQKESLSNKTEQKESLSDKTEQKESFSSKKDSSPLRDDESVSKSDSSDDNIIVRIDNSNSSDNKRQYESAPEANKRIRQTASSDLETSELRPD